MGLREHVQAAVDALDGELELSTTEEQAQVRLEANGERVTTTWIYALAAPFASIEENLSLARLKAIWQGSDPGESAIFLAPETLALEAVLGVSSNGRVHAVPSSNLLVVSWSTSNSLTILPFDELEPRWKVLAVEGPSPIRKSFDPLHYPLRVDFGLSGEQGLVDRVASWLNLPATNRDPERMTVVMLTGVTALTRATAWQMERYWITYPAGQIGEWLLEPDFTHVSNEVSFYDKCGYPDPSQPNLVFCSDPRYIELLDTIDVDLVELTGNHGNDYGSQAFLETLSDYDERGWLTFGGGENLADSLLPALLEHHGNKLAFLGCNVVGPPKAWATEDKPGAAPCGDELFDGITELAEQGYQVIFTYQWGEGGELNEAMRKGFRKAADAGAVIVSGSQAHQPLGYEFYQGSLIHYGLGNLFFDQMQSLPLRQEMLDRHVFYDGRLISTEILTALLENYAQPRPMTTDERSAFLTGMFEASGWLQQ